MSLFSSFLLLLFCQIAQSQEFLALSPILKKHELELVPVEPQSTRKFLLFADSDKKDRKILLSEKGEMIDLRKADDKKRPLKSESCGSETLSHLYEAEKDANALFALMGKEIPKDLKLQWLPLKEVPIKKPEHPKIKKGYEVSRFQAAESEDKEIFYFLEADSKQKLNFALLERKWGEKVYEKFSPDCSNPEYALQMIGKISNKGINTTYLSHPVDCDGIGYKKGSLDRPIAILEISEKNQKEKWVIFRANGYEGDAYLAVEYSTRKGKPRRIDFYVYSGC